MLTEREISYLNILINGRPPRFPSGGLEYDLLGEEFKFVCGETAQSLIDRGYCKVHEVNVTIDENGDEYRTAFVRITEMGVSALATIEL